MIAQQQPQENRQKLVDLTKNEFDLTNERFLVPEMIFRPADLGMNQAGLPECIIRAVNACHPHLHPVLYESIILTGGSTLFPHFAERLFPKRIKPHLERGHHHRPFLTCYFTQLPIGYRFLLYLRHRYPHCESSPLQIQAPITSPLEKELRPLVPDDYHVKITTQEDPLLGVWRGGSLLASSPDFDAMCVTKAEYEELGSARCRKRFFH
ncbi:actin-related protein 6-like [Trifolium pratense]|uniref:Actin-related protein 6-like n=1 Tax=Trifolium pratense TaxID=57577 RepID=A0A2K3N523_TRIPR|nr:actin-related protein 6-like [Trifolium pratense]